ncbi:hypothetical protein ACTFIW_003826 [Dictyostelium discoideum]
MDDKNIYKKIVLIVGYYGALRSSEIHSLKRDSDSFTLQFIRKKTDHSNIGQTVIVPFTLGQKNEVYIEFHRGENQYLKAPLNPSTLIKLPLIIQTLLLSQIDTALIITGCLFFYKNLLNDEEAGDEDNEETGDDNSEESLLDIPYSYILDKELSNKISSTFATSEEKRDYIFYVYLRKILEQSLGIEKLNQLIMATVSIIIADEGKKLIFLNESIQKLLNPNTIDESIISEIKSTLGKGWLQFIEDSIESLKTNKEISSNISKIFLVPSVEKKKKFENDYILANKFYQYILKIIKFIEDFKKFLNYIDNINQQTDKIFIVLENCGNKIPHNTVFNPKENLKNVLDEMKFLEQKRRRASKEYFINYRVFFEIGYIVLFRFSYGTNSLLKTAIGKNMKDKMDKSSGSFWDKYDSWNEAEKQWEENAEREKKVKPLRVLQSPPQISGITEEPSLDGHSGPSIEGSFSHYSL